MVWRVGKLYFLCSIFLKSVLRKSPIYIYYIVFRVTARHPKRPLGYDLSLAIVIAKHGQIYEKEGISHTDFCSLEILFGVTALLPIITC